MSFFGFDAMLARDRGHSASAPGFGQTPDAFAGLGGGVAGDDDAIDFEDTYDGLGDGLDETDDAFNDDTFGGGPASQQSVGKDFDFAGQTSKIAHTLQEEQMLYQTQQPPSHQQRPPPPKPSKPARTGYESYHDPNYIPQLEARADIWGLKPKHPVPAKQPENQAPPPPQPAKKMMSLEEVEAMIRAQTLQHEEPAPVLIQPQQAQPPPLPVHPHQQVPHSQPHFPGIPGQGQFVPQILQRPQQPQQPQQPQHAQQHGPHQRSGSRHQQVHAELPGHSVQAPPVHHPTILQRQRPPPNEPSIQQHRHAPPQPTAQRPASQPRQILQNPSRLSGQGQPMAQPGPPASRGPAPGHSRGPSYPSMVVTNPEQLLHLSKEEREAFLAEDAKRAKRNHKIALLSKDNGLMTPQDKNFITRIQLQQLMTATGNLNEQTPEAAIAEDFYYQVFSQIRGALRQTPHQPASQFAQTYLFQTNGRYGPGRRHGRGADNHMQRMEQQVQRAVEAAKAKPKAKQLTIEGSLGKISFSNSKTPRPLLSMKRPESTDKQPSKPHKVSVADRTETLRNIENVYMTLMHMEDHERTLPAPINQDSDPEAIQRHMEWRTKIETLHKKLWDDIKIMEPINPNPLTPHPFIAILSHAKGKKAIPRIFRHIDEQERITILTMVVIHLDKLNVVSHGIATPEEPLSPALRDEIELFLHSVVPPLYAHIFESPLNIIIGLLGLILERNNVHVVARTKIGMSLLIMLISRAELLKQPPEINVVDWENWTELYNRLFDAVEPILPLIFPGSINDTDDMYVWQFLAAMGVGASPEQQQRLVIGVKDRVMETVGVSKALPPEMAGARLANVNLFMRAIGLDVELLG
ncbi:uncharacterized protein BDR25DRAFT_282143 [Lindgomyces ingoldianus]|uniref:Uncharacterized protein n=1 Tax=Lindgomyces ingoldianus TaxID=673940 RepID=A0ACB6R566_9PLEO|nr:uncharacterized protein BDR25DRAFT_282143 [Lindgomyces ingoldianus]KAF2473978.1 hypothetical protein BDR25DRAFT_282143 [Lindgomyces ingoldianus]